MTRPLPLPKLRWFLLSLVLCLPILAVGQTREDALVAALHKECRCTNLHKKCRYTNQSANGAQYDSQGQARSASPLVCGNCKLRRPERPKYDRYYALSGLHGLFICYPGATRFALAPGYHISRRWRSGIFRAVGALVRLFVQSHTEDCLLEAQLRPGC